MQLWPRGSATAFCGTTEYDCGFRLLNFELLLRIYEIHLGLELCKITNLTCTCPSQNAHRLQALYLPQSSLRYFLHSAIMLDKVMNTGINANFMYYNDLVLQTMNSSVNSVSLTSFRCKSWFVVSESDPFSSEHFGQETVLAVESSSHFRRPSVAKAELPRKYKPKLHF